MAIKRRREHGDGVVDSPAELAESRGDGTLGSSSPSSSSEFAKSIYLVAEQEINEQSSAAHSIIKIDADAAAAGDDEPRRARTVADLHDTEHGTSFVAAHSEHGSWIVSVGGRRNGFVTIFDPSTLKTFRGQRIVSPKHQPVLIDLARR